MKNEKKIKAQVWIETMIYTLIGLSIIAIMLTIAFPQIEKIRDRDVVKESFNALKDIDNKVQEVEQTEGNIRVVEFKITKGELVINSSNDSIKYILKETRLEMSEPGEEFEESGIIMKTEKQGSRFKIILTKYYDNLNITYKGEDSLGNMRESPTPYQISIENVGDVVGVAKPHIDIDVI